jgi:hypothetical protein
VRALHPPAKRLPGRQSRPKEFQALARTGIGPKLFTQTFGVIANQMVGGIQNMTVRAVVLLKLNQVANAKLALKIGHIAHIRAPKAINRLVVITNGKNGHTFARQQF